jgi:AraC-like DNA-binding protein
MIARATPMTVGSTIHVPLSDGPTVAASYVGGIVDYAVTCGVRRERVLGATGLRESDFDDPYRRLPIMAMMSAIRFSADALGDPAFSLHFGRDVDCAQVSMAAMMGRSARTTGEALLLVGRYAPLGLHFPAMGDAPRYHAIDDPRGTFIVDARPADDWPEITEAAFARMTRGIRRVGGDRALRAVHVRHRAPAHAAVYQEIFGARVVFAADYNAMVVDPSFLEQPLVPAPRHVTSVLTQFADDQLADLARTQSMRGRVEVVLRTLMSSGEVRIERVARVLAMSRQTLYRRLRSEGTTFEAVLDGARRARALELLSRERVTIGEVAALVGFSDAAAFSRAFKRWTGRAPAEARRG